MNAISSMFASNLMAIYLLGMSLVVVLAVVFCLSIRYYMKAKDLVPYMHRIKELVEKIAELQHKVEDVEKQLKDKLAEVTHAEKLIQQGKDAEEWLKAHKEEIETTQTILEKVRAEMQAANVQKTDLDRQISERQQQLVELEKKAVEAEQKVKDAEKVIEDIRRENAELTTRVPALRAERDVLQKGVDDLKTKIEGLEKELQMKTELLNKANGELERLNGIIAAKKLELEKLQDNIDVAAREVARLKGAEAVARQFIAQRDAVRDDEKGKWGSLETPVIKMSDIRDPEDKGDEKLWLDNFGKRLAENGFVFDPRAILAFHTGLKCAEKVPLVVLAGISGTGKSLLPELYSAALGMNFLSVPVQPRWDSPQDLFGFYNYMEGRYKATELARLLWQFDLYNGAARKMYDEGNIPLNMVLLDEMNIARVEYYFSDLLSKLETRNGLDCNKPQERAKAEIELECNASEKPRHMFVSTNTLFVGTMNEDESTQSLSDKVIDRANVLRFGRPKALGKEADKRRKAPTKSEFLDSYAQNGRITAEEWRGWHKIVTPSALETQALRFLHDTVTPVVEALDSVYRFYGFRVDDAMKEYVLNYPGKFKDAVADQIEMKILPKLNGVELQANGFASVRSAINEAIQKTGDAGLQKAFDEACPQDGTFFKWRGVMR